MVSETGLFYEYHRCRHQHPDLDFQHRGDSQRFEGAQHMFGMGTGDPLSEKPDFEYAAAETIGAQIR